jgi:hypothetical protein
MHARAFASDIERCVSRALTAVCLAASAHAYHLPEVHLHAILKTEAGQVGKQVHNANRTYDLGPFQISTAGGSAILKKLLIETN